MKLYYEYEAIQTDEELCNFYHKLLSATEGSSLAYRFAFAMIDFSAGKSFNPMMLFIQKYED